VLPPLDVVTHPRDLLSDHPKARIALGNVLRDWSIRRTLYLGIWKRFIQSESFVTQEQCASVNSYRTVSALICTLDHHYTLHSYTHFADHSAVHRHD